MYSRSKYTNYLTLKGNSLISVPQIKIKLLLKYYLD